MHNREESFAHEPTVALSRRLIPGLLAILLFLIFLAFMVGYFLGVKYTTDEFVTQIRQETLADQLLVSSVGTQNAATTEQESVDARSNNAETVAETALPLVTAELSPVSESTASAPVAAVESTLQAQSSSSVARYGAELIGFGTKGAAEEFIKRVTAYNPISLELRERQSKTPRGRVIKWYQVVTGKYEQKQDLQKVLDILIKKERLHDIKIVAYAPNAKDKDIA